MSEIGFFFSAMLILQVGLFSLPVEERIDPVELKYVCVSNITDEESQAKTPILLLHGLGGSHTSWKSLDDVLSFRTKRKVYTVDLRNHGDSPWNNRTDVTALTVDVSQFLDTHNIKKVHIIGHSLGGTIAVRYTLNNPDRVTSIIVEDMRPNGMVKETYDRMLAFFQVLREAIITVPENVTEDEARESIVNFMNTKMNQIGVTAQFTTQALWFLDLKLVDGKWHFKMNIDVILESMKDPDSFLGESSGLFEGPALFMYGTKSSMKVEEDKENIFKFFPRTKLIQIEGAAHIIHGEFPEFENEVVKFLNGLN